jgi:hypothetical protein
MFAGALSGQLNFRTGSYYGAFRSGELRRYQLALPIGIEIDGPANSDRRLLGIALTLERILGRPPAPSGFSFASPRSTRLLQPHVARDGLRRRQARTRQPWWYGQCRQCRNCRNCRHCGECR